MLSDLLNKNENLFGSMKTPAAIFFLWDVVFSLVSLANGTTVVNDGIFWWINLLCKATLVVMLFIGKMNIGVLIALVVPLLASLKFLILSFNVRNLFYMLGDAAIFFIAAKAFFPQISAKFKNIPKAVVYIPSGIFFLLALFNYVDLLKHKTSFSFGTLILIHESICALGYFFLAKALSETDCKNAPAALKAANTQSGAIPGVVSPAPRTQKPLPTPGVLLVRFSIDKLNELSGSYGFQSGKLIGRAVHHSLLEGMTVSDGDSAATLAGREYVCIVSISSPNSSLLKEKIEPLILENEEIKACGAEPLTQIVSSTREPLVIDGVVRSGRIEGSGGWCAGGMMSAWKESDSKTAQANKNPSDSLADTAGAEAPETYVPDTKKLMSLTDKLAHFTSLSLDRGEEEKMGAELLAGGDAALKIIVNYLISCASGRQTDYWWSNASYLVKMIKRFPGANAEQIYNALISRQTNIWEYHTQIKDVAQQELLSLKKASPEYDANRIPEELAQAELKSLYNSYESAELRFKRAVELRESSEGWSDENKAFYYYIIGSILNRINADGTKALPFYAAQIFHSPGSNSLGWHEIKKLPAFKDLSPSPENARLLHEMFPLPKTWSYIQENS